MTLVSVFVTLNFLPLYASASSADYLELCSSTDLSQSGSGVTDTISKWYILSESMLPTLRHGDAVLVLGNVTFDSIGIGDVIAFREPVPDGETADVIVSRVIDVLWDPANNTVIVTKGDANSGSIPGIDFPIYDSNYVGKAYCLALPGS